MNAHYWALVDLPAATTSSSLKSADDTIERHFRCLEALQQNTEQPVFVSKLSFADLKAPFSSVFDQLFVDVFLERKSHTAGFQPVTVVPSKNGKSRVVTSQLNPQPHWWRIQLRCYYL